VIRWWRVIAFQASPEDEDFVRRAQLLKWLYMWDFGNSGLVATSLLPPESRADFDPDEDDDALDQ